MLLDKKTKYSFYNIIGYYFLLIIEISRIFLNARSAPASVPVSLLPLFLLLDLLQVVLVQNLDVWGPS